MHTTVLVVPCYNEAERLDFAAFATALDTPGVSLLFVDDGSTDATLGVLQEFATTDPRIDILTISPNGGKAEAVRRGMLQALDHDPTVVGFFDADLATPVDEVLRLVSEVDARNADAIIGSRVATLGTNIDRSHIRHLLGRVFATAAAVALDANVYDTQCGAKVFKNTDILKAALGEPFHSRWAFDVELLGRLLAEDATIVEVPLKCWVHVPGSKIGFAAMVRAGLDLVQIRSHLRKKSGKK